MVSRCADIAYQETDERHIPFYTIVHQGGENYTVETHRYPFAGAANARVRLGVIAAGGGETRWLAIAEKDDDDVYLARVSWDGPTSLLVQTLDRAQRCAQALSVRRPDRRPELARREPSTPGSTCTTTSGSWREQASFSGLPSEPASNTSSSATAPGG